MNQYTHMLILADVPGDLDAQGRRTGQRYFYDFVALELLGMNLTFPVSRFVSFQLIPINVNNLSLVEMFKKMWPAWDNSQSPFPPEFWQPGEWNGAIGAHETKINMLPGEWQHQTFEEFAGPFSSAIWIADNLVAVAGCYDGMLTLFIEGERITDRGRIVKTMPPGAMGMVLGWQ